MKENSHLTTLLRNKGYKVTPARLAMLEIIAGKHVPWSVESLTKKVAGKVKKGVNKVTVYRTLAAFEQNGIVKRVDLRKDSVYFEWNDTHEHHHHMVCTECGTIEDFKLCDVDTLVGKIMAKSSHFKKIKEHSLELFGVCKTCQCI